MNKGFWMDELWAIENDRGAWLVEVGTIVTFERSQTQGSAITSGIVDSPVRTNAHGIVTHVKVRDVEGERKPILVPVSTFRSVRPNPQAPRKRYPR